MLPHPNSTRMTAAKMLRRCLETVGELDYPHLLYPMLSRRGLTHFVLSTKPCHLVCSLLICCSLCPGNDVCCRVPPACSFLLRGRHVDWETAGGDNRDTEERDIGQIREDWLSVNTAAASGWFFTPSPRGGKKKDFIYLFLSWYKEQTRIQNTEEQSFHLLHLRPEHPVIYARHTATSP